MNCGYCNTEEGKLHIGDCDCEVCPTCGGQYLTCDCTNKQRENKKRLPHIELPLHCERCLEKHPNIFMVPNENWKRLPKELHDEVLCKECYDKINEWIGEE